jgi:hypothetical protein
MRFRWWRTPLTRLMAVYGVQEDAESGTAWTFGCEWA